MRYLIIATMLILSIQTNAQTPNWGSIVKIVPDSIYSNDTVKLVTSFTYGVQDGSIKCFPLNQITTQYLNDTVYLNLLFEHPVAFWQILCTRYDTTSLFINNQIGQKTILVDWQMRDTLNNIPYTSLDIDTLAIQVYGSTHLKERAAASLDLFPNPVKDRLNLKGLKGKSGQIHILDLKGRLVKSTIIQESFDISDLDAGVYLVKIIDEQKVWSQKIVKE